jgi:hypothetical protein
VITPKWIMGRVFGHANSPAVEVWRLPRLSMKPAKDFAVTGAKAFVQALKNPQNRSSGNAMMSIPIEQLTAQPGVP